MTSVIRGLHGKNDRPLEARRANRTDDGVLVTLENQDRSQ